MTAPATAIKATRRHSKPVWGTILAWRLLRGYREYRRTGETPYDASIDLRRLFRLTNGRFNDAVAGLNRVIHPPRPFAAPSGILGPLDRLALTPICDDLRRDGLHIFGHRVSDELCDELRRFALRAPCHVKPRPDGPAGSLHVYDPDAPVGTQYKVDQQALHEHEAVQALAADTSLLAAAQAYLRCRPVFLGCSMWWSTAHADRPCSAAAQLFHFDMPQIKFVKFFVYLTDVAEENGPHVFVRGSHRRMPPVFMEDRRFGDDEIAAHYPPHAIARITGPAGTIFAEDTRGLHKGAPVASGHRLIFQLMYATGGFGNPAESLRLNDKFSQAFVETVSRHPRTYARFRLSGG